MICYDCENQFTYNQEDIYEASDTIEGQYIKYWVVLCPFCDLENKVC